ncbi:MAG TPA: sigma-70 family RNA polymerase sigma factor, partial [Verrucomicrobiae bacterium]|nr:sigma-70 family RNA polymerase sigma factor [Verrucomicrobiae bacterium]
ADLREPEKLRAWLCGIARNLIRNTLRREGREPAHVAEALELTPEPVAETPLPVEQAINREEEMILWRSLGKIPDIYREPLVLYYREHQSIEHVAAALEVSEEVVRQRLSRGRKMLQEQVLAFIEGALERTTPGRAFTVGVIATLPAFATSATAAGISAGAVKGSALAKTASSIAWINLLVGPLIGFSSSYFSVRAWLNIARTPRERECVWRQIKWVIVGVLLFVAALLGYIDAGGYLIGHPFWLATTGIVISGGFTVWIWSVVNNYSTELRLLRAEERARHPEMFLDPTSDEHPAPGEYRSKATLLGLPLVHIRLGVANVGAPPVVAWIAAGDFAIGILMAFGGVTVGAISVGSLSAGLLSIGTACVGPVALGTISIGVLSLGAMAAGLVAVGGVAVAWIAASGGIAVSHQYATGAHAIARFANDAVARDFFKQQHFGILVPVMFAVLAVFAIVPAALHARRTSKRSQSPVAS